MAKIDKSTFQPKPIQKPGKKSKKVTSVKSVAKKKPSLSPDSWDIVQSGKERKLVFYKKDSMLVEIEITPESLNDILVEINKYLIVDDNIADSWTYRRPFDSSMPDYLTLLSQGKILGTLPVDDRVGKKLAENLSRYFQKKTIIERIKAMQKTKKKRFYFLAFITVLITGFLLYSIIINILSGFGLTVPNF